MRHPLLLLLLLLIATPITPFAAGRGAPSRRIVRDANNRPVRAAGRRRGGRGRGGSSPTAKPVVGQEVSVLQKQHYRSGERTNGTVAQVLTRAAEHGRGFKVRLDSGIVGRTVELLGPAPAECGASGHSVAAGGDAVPGG